MSKVSRLALARASVCASDRWHKFKLATNAPSVRSFDSVKRCLAGSCCKVYLLGEIIVSFTNKHLQFLEVKWGRDEIKVTRGSYDRTPN
jgi:hypothetical protein